MKEKPTTIDVLEGILYYMLKEADTYKFSSRHIDIQNATFKLIKETPELRKFFNFREERKYSRNLDNALFFLKLGQIIVRPSNPALRYYEIEKEKLEQIEQHIKKNLPKRILYSIEKGAKKIRETDEFKSLVKT